MIFVSFMYDKMYNGMYISFVGIAKIVPNVVKVILITAK